MKVAICNDVVVGILCFDDNVDTIQYSDAIVNDNGVLSLINPIECKVIDSSDDIVAPIIDKISDGHYTHINLKHKKYA